MTVKSNKYEVLDRLERLMVDGFGVITAREGIFYFMQYVREAIRIITTETKRRRR